ncbi:hypothetical protein OG874_00430 [Nocardia sp. NBC_00565]|uniref:hypothetical protein n=1 Tax=Nocardia sp. NBC_00565 TaxID=2975993 RepID=UPI002E81ECF7|nr:hypothetical protein [Nocardia sp. NBC_00565]WUC03721.1 hypothetical protein OG874_00430 [Nocardia sp. NBC_00565]
MKYEAHVTGRDGRWWAVTIPALGEDALTQARKLSEVEDEARDYIAVTLDVAPSTVEIEVIIDDFGRAHNLQERSNWIRAARKLIEQLEDDVQRETQALTTELTAENVPMREIAQLVGTTFQRVGQLASVHGAPMSLWAVAGVDADLFERAREIFTELHRAAVQPDVTAGLADRQVRVSRVRRRASTA